MTLTVGSLCSGIGGFELGLERAGMRTIWHAETDPYASKVLAKHWPGISNLGDITRIDWSQVERPDLVCAGYPCQPFSYAGKRGGADDPRHLWPAIRECVRLLRPRWALFENVPGHLTLGFDRVLADLAALGMDAEWELLPAAAFGAPHLRYRLIIVAHTPRVQPRWQEQRSIGERIGASGESGIVTHANRDSEHAEPVDAEMACPPQPVADTDQQGLEGRRILPERPDQQPPRAGSVADTDRTTRRPARRPSQTVFGPRTLERPGRRSSSLRNPWEFEPDVGRVAHGIPHRVDRLRCLGNAVVPQVAQWVGEQILAAATLESP